MSTSPPPLPDPANADAAHSAVPAPGGSGIRIAASVRRHLVAGLLAGLLTVLAGAPLAWLKGSPKYSATAVVFVSPRFLANLQDSKEHDLQSDSQYRQYVQQNVRTINRFDIVVDALKKLGPNQSWWVKKPESLDHAAERLQGALDVSAIPDTYQIAVSLSGDKPVGIAEVVNSVVNTFLEKAKVEEFYASDERIRNLMADRARVEEEIAAKQEQRLALSEELGVSTFTNNFVNPYDQLLVGAKEALAAARRQNIEAEAQLASLDGQQRAGAGEVLQAMARQEAAKDVRLSSLEASQSVRRTQLLTQISGLAPDHPGLKAAEQELADLDRAREEVSKKLIDAAAKGLLDQKRAEAFRTGRVIQKLTAELEQQASQAAWFSRNYQNGIQLGNEIEQARVRISSVQERIDSLSLERRAPGFVRMFSAARTPDAPEKGGRTRLLAAVLVFGFLVCIVVPVGIDMLDPRLHTPRDVEKLLGFAPFGWMMNRKQAGPDFAREQSLRLASRMVQDHQNNGSRIFAFTSVRARGGTSTLVLNLAAALKSLGVPALAVEANAYRADPRYRSPDQRGLTIVLRGSHDIEDAVVPGDDELPDHVPLGDLSDQKNLPDIEKLMDILRAATETYRIVLVDLPPVLVSVDAEFIARGADVTVLVIRAAEVTRVELQKAAACLERIKVSAVSVLLNHVDIDAGDGFARSARQEFNTGNATDAGGWMARRFWK